MRPSLVAAFVVLLLGGCSDEEAGTSTSSEPIGSVTTTADVTQTSLRTGEVQHQVAPGLNPELREELLAMMVEDQAVRTGIPPPGDDRTADELFAAWDAVDAANTARMREILDEFGWPGWSLVGEDGAEAAWLLIQHADMQLDLQKRGLALLEAATTAGDASPGDLAYLTDRVLVAEGEPQIYGTQVSIDADGTITPRTPIEDEDNVDARRAAVGLGTLEEYYEEFRTVVEESP